MVEEINGQPADPESMAELEKYIGRPTDNLGAFPSKRGPSRMRRPAQHEKLLWDGPDVMDRWNAAKEAMGHINNRKLTYNLWGSDFDAPKEPDAPRPPVTAGNSNSVNRTLIDAMGLKARSMPLSAPGSENPLLPQNQVEQIQGKYGLLSPPKKRGLLGIQF